MRVVVTGGAGFLGTVLTERLLAVGVLRGAPIEQLVLTDRVAPRGQHLHDPRVDVVIGDLVEVLPDLFAHPVTVVVHLASAVSAEVEADAGLGMHSIVDATRELLAACRAASGRSPVVLTFASSVAVYGSDPALALPGVVDETTPALPQTTYGTYKLVCEQLIADATRRGSVDGRVARLMTVAVRPGPPNAAASGFLSTIVRDPLSGIGAICPVDPATEVAISSPRRTVDGILAVTEAERGDAPGRLPGRLPVNLPALTVRVQDLLDAVEDVGGAEARDRVQMRPDPSIQAIVGSWPARFAHGRAAALGLRPDASALEIVREFAGDR